MPEVSFLGRVVLLASLLTIGCWRLPPHYAHFRVAAFLWVGGFILLALFLAGAPPQHLRDLEINPTLVQQYVASWPSGLPGETRQLGRSYHLFYLVTLLVPVFPAGLAYLYSYAQISADQSRE